jgi:hypothetical protein
VNTDVGEETTYLLPRHTFIQILLDQVEASTREGPDNTSMR